MAGLAQDFLAAGTAIIDGLVGTFDGGYFVDAVGSAVYLRHASAPDTVLDTYTYSDVGFDAPVLPGFPSGAYGVQGIAGSPFMLRDPNGVSDYVLSQIGISGETLSVSTIGTVTRDTYAFWMTTPGADQFGLVTAGGTDLVVYDVAPFGTAYSLSLTGLGLPVGLPATDRWLSTSGGTVTLRNTGGTALDTATDLFNAIDPLWMPSVSSSIDVVAADTGNTIAFNRLSAAGDSLTWASATTYSVGHDYANLFSITAGYWGGLAVVAPANTSPDDTSVSLIWMNPGTGRADAGAAGNYADNLTVALAGYGYTINTDAVFTTWKAPAPPATSLLRQRQSPRRSPSRVGWY